MTDLSPTVDPVEAGFDPARLGRIDDVLRRYVDDGLLPHTELLLTRRGEIVHHHRYGFADIATGRPIQDDAVYRIYSMTKPITSVALMMLHEQGKVLLEDPIERYLPDLADPQVWVSGDPATLVTRPAERPIRVKDLLTHTAGLTYGFQHATTVDALYRQHELGDFGVVPTYTNAEMVKLLGTMPLQFTPGTGWWYSMATGVVGALIEVLSGQTLDEHLRQHVLEPLGMVDTAFWVDDERADRLPTCYYPDPTVPGGLGVADTAEGSVHRQPPTFLDGGGGLLSTMADYHRFTECLARGGELDGVRLLSPRTLRTMTQNHLPQGKALTDMSQNGFSEAAMEGMGFGLGFIVNLDPATNGALGSVGDYGWGGAASTIFNIDPVEELTMTFMTQLLPSNTHPIRRQLRATIYQALVD